MAQKHGINLSHLSLRSDAVADFASAGRLDHAFSTDVERGLEVIGLLEPTRLRVRSSPFHFFLCPTARRPSHRSDAQVADMSASGRHAHSSGPRCPTFVITCAVTQNQTLPRHYFARASDVGLGYTPRRHQLPPRSTCPHTGCECSRSEEEKRSSACRIFGCGALHNAMWEVHPDSQSSKCAF